MWRTKRRMIINILIGFVIILCVLTFYNTFSMNTEYVFDSLVYDIDNNYIKNISSNTGIDLYLKYFDMENCSIEVFSKDDKKITDGFVTNGSKTVLYNANGTAIREFINVIKGDFNSDGLIDMTDFYDMGKCLVDNCEMDEYLFLSVDINDDKAFHINDIMLLDKAITLGYTGVKLNKSDIILQSEETGRLVAKVEPNYGVNLNVKWSSADKSIATVNEAGIVTGHNEGSTVVKATTLDGKYVAEAVVKVDNTIQLDSYSGIGYVGGKDVVVDIKAVKYDDITCSVDNRDIATCKIKENKLIIENGIIGSTKINVNSSKYGSVTYDLVVNTLNVFATYRYVCVRSEGSAPVGYFSSFHGESFFEINDSDIVKDASIQSIGSGNGVVIKAGTKTGRTRVKVLDKDGNTRTLITVDVYKFYLNDMFMQIKAGNSANTTILGNNIGQLSCEIKDPYGNTNDNNSLGICEIKDNQLIVTPLGSKELWVYVYNKMLYNGELYDCGSAMFSVFVQE